MSDYKRNPRGARRARKSMGRKAIVVLSLMMVLVMAAVGGTLAWLTATTTPVTNTFTTSDINITLTETGATNSNGALANSYKMIPGFTITKDPTVAVVDGSEDCWLFVKVEKSSNFDDFMTYTIADGWTQVTGTTNVYARKVKTTDTDKSFAVLLNNTVTVKDTVTKEAMNGLTTATYPTLTVTAYATQLYSTNNTEFSAETAWAKVAPTT